MSDVAPTEVAVGSVPRVALFLGCVADDITGATDLASALVEVGIRTTLLLGVPDTHTGLRPDSQAVVVALKSRGLPAADAIAQTVAAVDWLEAAGAPRIYLKYCSTFDSTDEGNIGPVADAVMDRTGTSLVVHAPSYPANGRTVYQGHLFVGSALLSESGMERHPLTPMTDPNLVRVLSAQTEADVSLLPLTVVREGDAAVHRHVSGLEGDQPVHVIADALTGADLDTVARALTDRRLLAGGAAFGAAWAAALGALEAFRGSGGSAAFPLPQGAAGSSRDVVLVGSASSTSRRQVARFGQHHTVRRLTADLLDDPTSYAADLADWIIAQPHEWPVLLGADTSPDGIREARARHGKDGAAERIEQTLALVAARLVTLGVRRLVVAGGETSGAVAAALGLRALEVGPAICAGVPWTVSTEPDVLVAFKSGNFGDDGFFLDALEQHPAAPGASA